MVLKLFIDQIHLVIMKFFILHVFYDTDLMIYFSDNCPENGCLPRTADYFDWQVPGIGRNIFFFILDGIVIIILLLMLEFRLFERLTYFIQKSDVKIGTGEVQT
jgi:hypothetical protein